MELLISLLMGTRLLTLLGGGLGHGAAVEFMPPQIIVAAGEIRLSCALVNAYPEELRKLAKTATPVYICLFVEIREEGRRQPVNKTAATNMLVYDMVGGNWRVTRSTSSDTVRCTSLDSAMAASSSFPNVNIASKSAIKRDAAYSITAFAALGKSRVAALHDKEIDCMFYWDFKRPSFKTETISGGQLVAAGR